MMRSLSDECRKQQPVQSTEKENEAESKKLALK